MVPGLADTGTTGRCFIGGGTMSDKTKPGSDGAGAEPAGTSDGRRAAERRQAQQPIKSPDRRKSERRSGSDRRTSLRSDDPGQDGG